jgi:hypothetical protein
MTRATIVESHRSPRNQTFRSKGKQVRSEKKHARRACTKQHLDDLEIIQTIVADDSFDHDIYGRSFRDQPFFAVGRYMFDHDITAGIVDPDNECLNCDAYSLYHPGSHLYGCANCRRNAQMYDR